jgi:hypothetical protein
MWMRDMYHQGEEGAGMDAGAAKSMGFCEAKPHAENPQGCGFSEGESRGAAFARARDRRGAEQTRRKAPGPERSGAPDSPVPAAERRGCAQKETRSPAFFKPGVEGPRIEFFCDGL